MLILTEPDPAAVFEGIDFLFIDIDHEIVPFLVKAYEVREDHTAQIQLEDIGSDIKAKPLVGCELYIPKEQAGSVPHQSRLLAGVEGYKVVDLHKGYIGEIRQVISLKEQDLLRILFQDKEILVPAVKEYISGIDQKKRELYITTPEGLLELYLT
jgi:16S rRNA processing protein RimM